MRAPAWLLVGGLLFAASASAQQANPAHVAEFLLINQDAALVGLNDPTPAKPVGSNPGTTVGKQRRLAYQFAMDLWSTVLRSPVTVNIQASFAPLQCDTITDPKNGKDVLGSAKAIEKFETQHGLKGIKYQSPLANAIDGMDHGPLTDEITSHFNSVMGGKNANGTDCMPGLTWYYGLDGKTPAHQTNFVNIVMHEIGHGLGFAGNEDFGGDIYSHFAYDNLSGQWWNDMDFDGRDDAMTDQRVTFRGPNVHAAVPFVLGPKMVIRFSGALQHDVTAWGTGDFSPTIVPGVFNGPLIMVNDGVGDDHADACEPLLAGSLIGRVAFINRGNCDFEFKAKNAKDAGAVAVIIGNVATSSKPEETIGMAHSSDPNVRVSIAAVQLPLTEANLIRNAPLGGITAQAANIPGQYQGADENNNPYLFAPATYSSGSTFSHFDTTASPNVLMEPANSADLAAHVNLDLTPALLADEGWTLNQGNGMIDACDTGIKAVTSDGKIIGANVQAYARTCLAAATEAGGSRVKYLRCMTDHANELLNAKLIDTTQKDKIRTCAAGVTP